MSHVKPIPDPYTTADKTLLDKIKGERPCTNGILAQWWRVGNFFCTLFDNGYYHCYLLKMNIHTEKFCGTIILIARVR